MCSRNEEPGPSTRERTTAFSIQLRESHARLNQRVNDIRDAVAEGRVPTDGTRGLAEHCLTFCDALQNHHTGEDTGLFPQLKRDAPELSATIDALLEDHQMITALLTRLRELVEAPPEQDTTTLLRAIDGIAAIMTSHFNFEERTISDAIDRATPGPWTQQVL